MENSFKVDLDLITDSEARSAIILCLNVIENQQKQIIEYTKTVDFLVDEISKLKGKQPKT